MPAVIPADCTSLVFGVPLWSGRKFAGPDTEAQSVDNPHLRVWKDLLQKLTFSKQLAINFSVSVSYTHLTLPTTKCV